MNVREKMFIIFSQLIFSLTYNKRMSKGAVKRDTTYSEFRKKNSLSKSNLSKSMIEPDLSMSHIVDKKTEELLSIESELQSLVRNRSLTNKLHANSNNTGSFTTRISKKNSL